METYLESLGSGTDVGNHPAVDCQERILAVKQFPFTHAGHEVAYVVLSVTGHGFEVVRILVIGLASIG